MLDDYDDGDHDDDDDDDHDDDDDDNDDDKNDDDDCGSEQLRVEEASLGKKEGKKWGFRALAVKCET